MSSKKDQNSEQKKYLVQCLRCGKRSYVRDIAKCKYCGSFSVKLLTKKKDE